MTNTITFPNMCSSKKQVLNILVTDYIAKIKIMIVIKRWLLKNLINSYCFPSKRACICDELLLLLIFVGI